MRVPSADRLFQITRFVRTNWPGARSKTRLAACARAFAVLIYALCVLYADHRHHSPVYIMYIWLRPYGIRGILAGAPTALEIEFAAAVD